MCVCLLCTLQTSLSPLIVPIVVLLIQLQWLCIYNHVSVRGFSACMRSLCVDNFFLRETQSLKFLKKKQSKMKHTPCLTISLCFKQWNMFALIVDFITRFAVLLTLPQRQS